MRPLPEPRLQSFTDGSLLAAWLVVALACGKGDGGAGPALASGPSVSRHGITWIFAEAVQYGQFANGDYWVVGPVTIVGIDPPSVVVNGRTMNGSMVNPVVAQVQGYDSAMYDGAARFFDAAMNVARPGGNALSVDNPLRVAPGSSLVSSISKQDTSGTVDVDVMAVLTVLPEPAPEGSFRPPYYGNDKTLRFDKASLNYQRLLRLRPSVDAPPLSRVEAYFEKPWIDHVDNWSAEQFHPASNMPNYGREMAAQVGEAALMLLLDFDDTEKETLLVRFVQLGIDNFAIKQDPTYGLSTWSADGGHMSGRAWPILFAGLMLGDEAMSNALARSGDHAYANGYREGALPPDYSHYGELDQTFYVTQRDIERERAGAKTPYASADLGLPEWGIRHVEYPEEDDRSFGPPESSGGAAYRESTGPAWNGYVLASHLMGAERLWNSGALIDYMDRFMELKKDVQVRTWSAFTESMWDTYRDEYGCTYERLSAVAGERVYRCGAQEIDCGTFTNCTGYGTNQRALERDPCGHGCAAP